MLALREATRQTTITSRSTTLSPVHTVSKPPADELGHLLTITPCLVCLRSYGIWASGSSCFGSRASQFEQAVPIFGPWRMLLSG